MLTAFKSAFAALAVMFTMASASGAATIPFQINSAGSSVSITNCVDILCVARAELAPNIAGNPTINVTRNGGEAVFDFIVLRPIIDFFDADTFDITATLSFLSPSFGVSGSGSGSDFTTGVTTPTGTGIFGFALRFTSGVLTWSSIPSVNIPGVGLTTIKFITPQATAFGDGTATNPRSVTLQASISVVPLPAGILLLGTALLGLFGLSRRRKFAAA